MPHVITPLTDDRETLTRLLPSLNTGLVYIQGANLAPALVRAGEMLAAGNGTEKHILVISDGGFGDGDAAILKEEKSLAKQGVRVHTMGVGTAQGAPVPDGKGGYEKENGTAVIARLEQDRMQRIAQDGGGLYFAASYLDNDTRALLARIGKTAGAKAEKTTRFWEERFYIFLAPLVLLLLPWFRRNAVFPALVLLMLHPGPAQAFEWKNLFLNKDQQGKAAIAQQHYDQAAQTFEDPYRRGVAQYKAGEYAAAEQSFAKANRPDIAGDARYNLGNAQLMGGKIQDAINTYEQVLKDDPDNKDAAYNLDIAKKLLEQQKKRQQQNQKDQKQDNQQNQKDQQNKDQQGSQQKQGDQGQKGDNDNQSKQQQDREKQDNKDQKGQGEKQDQKDQQDQNEQNQSGQDQDKDKDKQQQAQQQKDQDRDKKQNEEQNKDQEQDRSGQQEKPQDQQKPGDQNQQAGQDQQKDGQKDDQKGMKAAKRTQKDIDADQWLDRVQNDPEQFLKNKFYIESKRQGAKQGDTPW